MQLVAANGGATATIPPGEPALIVLGRDGGGKAHASWFDQAEAEDALKAAGLMGMQALRVASDEVRKLGGQLPHGRVFASGRAFVPFVQAATFDKLASHLPHAGIAPLRLAEAVNEEREAAAKAEDAPPPSGDDAAGDKPDDLPGDWSKIKVGSVVLAVHDDQESWWEAKVEKVSDDNFSLRWFYYPDAAPILRRRRQIALLHPGYNGA